MRRYQPAVRPTLEDRFFHNMAWPVRIHAGLCSGDSNGERGFGWLPSRLGAQQRHFSKSRENEHTRSRAVVTRPDHGWPPIHYEVCSVP